MRVILAALFLVLVLSGGIALAQSPNGSIRGIVLDPDAKMLEDVTSTSVEAAPIRYLHASRPTFHLLDKPLSFDDAQEGVLRQTLPLVLVGSAGSGKKTARSAVSSAAVAQSRPTTSRSNSRRQAAARWSFNSAQESA